ncbi:MAG: hypothetical protein JXA36_03435 [Coriobacteriia bacterium]|nr:hypothetical protein [Coriobacteriia bacterium]
MYSASVHPPTSPISTTRRALGSADYVTAEAVARRALEDAGTTSTDRVEAGLLLGRVLARTARLDECISTLRTAIESEEEAAPPTVEVRFDLRRELGQALWTQNRKEQASRWFLAALQERPDAPEDAEARRLILELELLTLVGSDQVVRASEHAFEVVETMLAHGLSSNDWRWVLEALSGLAVLEDPEVDPRIVTWLEAAEAHCNGADDAKDGGTARHEAATASLLEYAQELKRTHPRDLDDAHVRELEKQLELAWSLMGTRQLVDWFSDACSPYYLARTGWKSVLALWQRVFDRADRYVGCAGSTAWDELTSAASHLAGWCKVVGDFSAAVRLRRLILDANRSLGHDLSTAISGRALATTLLQGGDADEALRALNEAAEFHQRDRYMNGALDAWARSLRIDILAAMGDLAGAETLNLDQLEADSLEYGEDSSHVGWDALRLAELLADMGRTSEATQLLKRAAAAPEEDVDSVPGDRDYMYLFRRLRLGKLRVKLEACEEAAGELLSVAREAAVLFGYGNAAEAEALTEWAAVASSTGMSGASVEEAAARALRIQCYLRHPEHPKAVRAAEVAHLVGA